MKERAFARFSISNKKNMLFGSDWLRHKDLSRSPASGVRFGENRIPDAKRHNPSLDFYTANKS